MNKYDREHQKRLEAIQQRIDAIYSEAVKEAAALGVTIDMPKDAEKPFSFDDYPLTEKRVNELLKTLREQLQVAIVNGVRSSWTLANRKNDELCNVVFGDNVKKLTKEQYKRYYSTNGKALEAFIERKENGLKLSDRVWNYSNEFKSEIEMGLDLGIRSGLDAPSMARELKQYLKYPDKLFRRVRDEHGTLQLSKAAADFHPGRGVYRSSYMNARRLAATETNIAYRTADHERWKKMDFVVGIEIHLSNNHNCKGIPKGMFHDICDDLKGRYPKDFKFTGWHPHCRCYATSILKTDEEVAEDTKKMLRGEEVTDESKNTVEDVPDGFKQWVKENEVRIDRAEARGTLPYWMRDNKELLIENEKKSFTTNDLKEAIEEGKEELSLSEIFGTKYDEDVSLSVDYFGRNVIDWDNAKKMTIPTDRLHSVQDVVFPEIVEKYVGKKRIDAIQVIEVDGNLYVHDGNHRAAAAIIRGDSTIKADVVRLPKSEFNRLYNLASKDRDSFAEVLMGMVDLDDVAGAKLQGARANGLKSAFNHLTFKEDAQAEQKATTFTEKQKENHKEVSKAIGVEQGERKTFKDADSGRANPNYNWFDAVLGIESEYNVNCTSTVATHELRMRGWNVESKPFDKKDSTMTNMKNGAINTIWIDPETGKAPAIKRVWAKTLEKTSLRFEKATEQVGRYHITVKWRGGNGHVFCVDRLPDGTMRVYDPQNNQLNIMDWMNDIEFGKGIGVLKVDGLLINPKEIKHVVRPVYAGKK